jgi:hypothetical protein
MKLFKLIASKAGKVVFDDRIEAENPRKAREQMKSLLRLQSLTGVVYSITEIPVELIREIVATKVLEIVGSRRAGAGRAGSGASIDVSKIVEDAANVAVADRLRPIEQRLASLESSRTAAGGNSTPIRRFDAFSREPTRSREAAATASNGPSARNVAPEPTFEPGTDWRAVKKFYKQTRSPKQTAARFDLSINTVKARVRREGW